MKRLPFLLLAAVLAFCSCKNSQELINEKAEQYKKEGKIILNKSDDPTGKEHYIVFADVNEQTIGIDTLGEKVETIKLANIVEKTICTSGIQSWDQFFVISNYPDDTKDADIKIESNETFTKDMYENWEATVYKDKYMVLKTAPGYDLGTAKKWSILWFKDPKYIYTYKGTDDKDVVMKENGDIKITIEGSEDFYAGGYDKQWITSLYHVTFDCNGNIKDQDDYVDYEGTNVPVTAFGDEAALRPYIVKINNSIIIGNAQQGIYF